MSEPKQEDPEVVKARIRAAADVLENYTTEDGRIDATKLTQELTALAAKVKALEGENAKLKRECEIREQAMDRWVPCPDHRDKTEHGRCLVCDLEAARGERDGAYDLLKAMSLPSAYEGERTGGVLAGCPRAAPLTPEQIATKVRIAVQAIRLKSQPTPQAGEE